MRRFERWRYRTNRWLARYRTNAAVALAFVIASVVALIAASLLL